MALVGIAAENRAHVNDAALSTHTSVIVRWPITIGSGNALSIKACDLGWYMPTNIVVNTRSAFTVVSAAIEANGTYQPLYRGGSRSWVVDPGDNGGQTGAESELILATSFGFAKMLQGSVLWYRAELLFSAANMYLPVSDRSTAHRTGSQVRSFIKPATAIVNGVDGTGPFTFSGTNPMTRTLGYCPFFLGELE